jgi:hypothetical protein
MIDMNRRKLRSHGPQALAAQAQYLLNERRLRLWIPFLEGRIAELQANIEKTGRNTQQE